MTEDPRSYPQAIRSLLMVWGLENDEEARDAARRTAGAILERTAPLEGPWAKFPLLPGATTVSLPYAADAMEAVAQLWAAGGGGPYLGRAQHIAHILQSQQGRDGSWPQECDLVVGDPVTEDRCAAFPMLLMIRLDQLLERCEFTDCVRRARAWLLSQKG